MQKVFIIGSKRTPIGSFGGSLSQLGAVDLGAIAAKAAIEQGGIDPQSVEEVFFGNVCQANLGQAPARQVALKAGLSESTPCTTVNKVCSSGLKSIMLAAQTIQLGFAECILAGGMESMSNIPYYLPEVRWGKKYGDGSLVDGLQKDGLVNVYDQKAMGTFADATAFKYGFSREDQDRYAIQSYERSATATKNGLFEDEIAPVNVPQRKGEDVVIKIDEEFSRVDFEKLKKLNPAFSKDGTVTAGNASTINDGASAILVASEGFVKAHGLKPIAEILGFADAAREPAWFTIAPVLATPKALDRAGIKNASEIDIFEVNEAFATVPMAFGKELGIAEEKMNVLGGAVSLGHPLGASGSRIVNTLITALHHSNGELGCATLCNGGGGASALILKKV